MVEILTRMIRRINNGKKRFQIVKIYEIGICSKSKDRFISGGIHSGKVLISGPFRLTLPPCSQWKGWIHQAVFLGSWWILNRF